MLKMNGNVESDHVAYVVFLAHCDSERWWFRWVGSVVGEIA